MKTHWSYKLANMIPCFKGFQWAQSQPSLSAAWRNCERGDWMIWLIEMTVQRYSSAGYRNLVSCAIECDRLVVKLSDNKDVGCARRFVDGSRDDIDCVMAHDVIYRCLATDFLDDESNKQTANIVREYFPKTPRLKP